MSQEEIQLTDEQKVMVLNEWNSRPTNPPSLNDLVRAAFPALENIDGRSKEGRAIKALLASKQIRARGAQEYVPKEKTDLTDEQKEYIANNAATMKAVEIARTIFKNDDLTNLNQETRTVNEYIKTLDGKVVYGNTEDVPDADYRPPKTIEKALTKVNRYVHEGIDKDKVTSTHRRNLQALIGYLHTYRFLHQINTYPEQTDRDLFESSFVRYTYDKSDLTQEEVDQYIVLSTEVVISSNIQRAIQIIQKQIELEVESGGKIPMTLVEASNTARTEYNQCVNRQQKLLSDLKVKRSERIGKQTKENASILNLVQMWKEEETRVKMIKLAELQKKSIAQEIDRLSSMDEIKCRIMGLSSDEALNG